MRTTPPPARLAIAAALALLLGGGVARADDGVAAEPAPRRPDATWREIFGGPFQSSRLFSMPTADVVGAYQISLSGDASLLARRNTLSTSSVVALGFGDIAQLEYRNAAAITTLQDDPFGMPTVGVQLKVPLRPRRYVPAFALALRFGFTHTDKIGAVTHDERATDLYVVSRLRLWGPLERVTLHGGLRVSAAQIDSTGEPALDDVKRNLPLPAGGFEVRVTDDALIAAELAEVPLFDPGDATRPSRIGSGIFGRAGIRWHLLPSVVLDASFGYRLEVDRVGAPSGSMADALVDWDMRLGGELFVPWGAMACKAAGIFCE